MNAHVFRSNPISGFFKKAAAFVGLSAMVLGGGAAGALADASAHFNDISGANGDYPTLQVAKSGEDWSTSTTASAGQTVSLLVWDHNTNPDVTAQNVKVKVSLPTGFATSFTPTATVSADNAVAATGSSTITVGSQAKLAYVAGSARFYRMVNGTLTQVSFPTGVNGDDVVAGGVNLGSQNGCWQYAQAVMIQVQVQAGNASIHTEKKVAVYGGNQVFGDSVTVNPGDVVAFRIYLENTGTADATGVRINDVLDSHLSYVPNTSTFYVKENNQDVQYSVPDSKININGQNMTWAFFDMAPNPTSGGYLVFQAKASGTFVVGDTSVNNCATVTAAGSISAASNCVTVIVHKAPAPVVTFSITKQISYGGNGWLSQAVGVAPGSQIKYRLMFQNTGNTAAQNVLIKDILPAGITYAGNARLYTTADPNTGTAIDASTLFTTGYAVPTLANGTVGTESIVFDAVVGGNCSGTPSLTNKGQVVYQGAVKAEATATAVLSCTKGLSIVKDVQAADGSFKQDAGQVKEDQVITYRIVVTNTGNTTITNPTLRDVLPQFTTYVNNSMTIDGQFMSQTVQSAFISAAGVTLTDFTPGMSKEIRYQVKVVSCPNLGDTTLTNTAFVKGDSVAEISDTATATLHVAKPVLAPVF